MVDRIERITRVKGINQGIDQFFNRKEGYADDKKKHQMFEQDLERELRKEPRPENEAGPDVPKASVYFSDQKIFLSSFHSSNLLRPCRLA